MKILGQTDPAAVNLGRVPVYAPQDSNLCSVIEGQTKLDTVVTDLK